MNLTKEEADFLQTRFVYYDGEVYRLEGVRGHPPNSRVSAMHLNIAGYRTLGVRLPSRNYRIALHSLVYLLCTGELPDPTVVLKHKDGNRLNCRYENLKPMPSSTVRHSSERPLAASGYRGVYPTATKKWYAQIGYNNKICYLGCFTSRRAAALAYNRKASELFGSDALINEGA